VGNIGLIARCYKYDLLRFLAGLVGLETLVCCSEWCFHFERKVPDEISLDPRESLSHVLFVGVVGPAVLVEVCRNAPDNFLFYKIHRTIHASPALYTFVHGLHHRAVDPTLLDSGTISPFELFLTDLSMPCLVLVSPNFFVMGFEHISAFWHFRAHGFADGDVHHLSHHKSQKSNFGLHDKYDKKFGTFSDQ
jgi:sterol desaturase/sphingolipid hydroxylase (fatty acid hydroxylase superfamily)